MTNPQSPAPPDPTACHTQSRFAPLTLIIAGTLGFIATAADILCHGQLQRWDTPLHTWFHEHANPTLMFLCAAISGLGELPVILAVALVVGLILIRKKRVRTLTLWIIALLGSAILNPTLKNIFRVPRPADHIFWIFKENSGYSFPSGHTMAVAITAGTLALVLLHHTPTRPATRWLIGILVSLLALLEAFALLYIGVHYLTDVIAALALSAAWLGLIRLLLPPAPLSNSRESRIA